MKWKNIKSNGFIEVDGNRYDLSHLQDATYNFTIEATEQYDELNFNVLVQYGSHCVSWGPDEGQLIDFSVHGQDKIIIDETGIHRCFSDDRHTLSLNLPDVFRTIINRRCYFTGRQNWLTIEVLGAGGTMKDYEIFFNLSRWSSGMLRLYVESAYVRTQRGLSNKPSHFRKNGKVYAKTLFSKKLRKKPLRQPPEIIEF